MLIKTLVEDTTGSPLLNSELGFHLFNSSTGKSEQPDVITPVNYDLSTN